MAKPAETYSILPDASAYTGKKIRAESSTVSANTVLSHEFPYVAQARVLGVYSVGIAQATVTVGAMDGISTGLLWMHMPTVISGRVARIRRVTNSYQEASAIVTATAPRLRMDRFTFTGTATGATAVGAKSTFGEPYPMLDLRTAVTGLTVSLVAAASTVALGGAFTAIANQVASTEQMVESDFVDQNVEEDAWMAILPGEGFVLYQDTIGTTSDARKMNINVFWDEVDAG